MKRRTLSLALALALVLALVPMATPAFAADTFNIEVKLQTDGEYTCTLLIKGVHAVLYTPETDERLRHIKFLGDEQNLSATIIDGVFKYTWWNYYELRYMDFQVAAGKELDLFNEMFYDGRHRNTVLGGEYNSVHIGFSSPYDWLYGDDVVEVVTTLLSEEGFIKIDPSVFAADSTPAPTINLDTADTWAQPGITEAVAKGFVPSDIQNSYTNVITRAEFCRLAVKWVEYALDKDINTILTERAGTLKEGTFSDTTDPAILAAYQLGITSGEVAPTADKPGVFNPSGQFNRQSAATMIRNVCAAHPV